MDKRIETLAHNLINYSTHLEVNEKILIEVFDDGIELGKALVREAYKAGAVPFLSVKMQELQRELIMGAKKEQLQFIADYESMRMKGMSAYIAVRGSNNVSEMSDVPQEEMKLYQMYWLKPVHGDIRVPQTKWCILRYPNSAMAQLANMSTEKFTDYFFDVCNLDYGKMHEAMTPLKKRMEKTDKVHIKGPGTDISFSIKNMPAVKCSGECNIPDGELYTAPVKNSVNGTITYNTPAVYQGVTFENISLTFRDGKIIEATANKTAELNKILDTDEGARYIGEFSFGLNPYITFPMKDTLFDEKISGSLHFTPGCAYDDADNTNRSSVHWDLVLIQTEAYGGGEIYLDGELIRKDGIFLPDDLQCLNPENLK
ncbi:aminopeptidase [Pectinatus haikarae]|uniref:Aminopeptidase n=1 Tax=Pectinatus haikarae TaxID=349096 RepID=A0ABT9YAZ8_9FIRM|nr:aminopeptidase [Pectinatus haikarae]MDQ0204997.1 aminopeptidase [Pectinatus haikarae]